MKDSYSLELYTSGVAFVEEENTLTVLSAPNLYRRPNLNVKGFTLMTMFATFITFSENLSGELKVKLKGCFYNIFEHR